MRIEFQVLGELRARVDGVEVDLGPIRQRSVLAALLVDVNRPVTADQLIDRVWGERAPRSASGTLRSYLSRLRTALSAVPEFDIERVSGGYVLRADPVTVDLHRFHDLLARARAGGEDAHVATLYEQAFAVSRDEPFAGLESLWFAATRRTVEAARYQARLDHHDVQLRLGRHGAVLADLSGLVAAHPQDERLTGQLVLALYRSGRQAEALEHYERIRVRLAEELGADVSPPLRLLHQQILTADAELSTRSVGGPVPRQLLAPPLVFAGRSRELTALSDMLDVRGRMGGTVVISAIAGTGGIGKTWLALQWAHQHLDSFPDGQLYANLRGFDPSATPTSPDVVLRAFLGALGTEASAIPASLDAQSALFRGLVADKRMLIVLDNVRDTEQVVPLLPGDRSCTVLVTSRRMLAGLVSAHSARSVPLDVLSADEALELLTSHLGEHRVAAEAEAVARLLDYCAGLPLALGIVVARAVVCPDLPLEALAAELHDEAARLDALDTGDTDLNLRAVLSWSAGALSPQAATVLALLGLAPGPDIGLSAVGSLVGLTSAGARVLLRELETAHLVSQQTPGRYRMHDLVRLYAAELAGGRLAVEDRTFALRRLVDFYTHTAFAGERLLYPHRKPIELEPAVDCRPEHLPNGQAALAWFEAEHACLLAVQQLAVRHHRHRPVWHLAWSLTTFHMRTANVVDRLTVWLAGLAAVEALGDLASLSMAHRYVADAYVQLGRHAEATRHLHQALAAAERFGDVPAQGHTRYGLASAAEEQGDLARALEHAAEALRLYLTLDNAVHIAQGHSAVGWFHALLGHYPQARVHSEQALAQYRELGNRDGEAGTLDTLGYIAHHSGDHGKAIDRYRQSIALFRELGHSSYEAAILVHLGQAHADLGEREQSREAWQRAREIYLVQDRVVDLRRIDEQLLALDKT